MVLLAGLVLTGLSRAGVGGFCGEDVRISVAAEPDIAAHVDALARGADGCYSFEVAPVSSADLSARIASREALPDIWVPDSAVRLAQLSQDVQIPFDTVLNSLASTPVVIAFRDTRIDMSTWTTALATPGLMMGDPVRSGIADAPILAATSEVENMRSTPESLGASMAMLAQGQVSRMEAPPASREMLDRVISGGGATIVTEREAVLSRRDAPGSGLEIAAPDTGAVFLGYPLAVTTQDPTRRAEVAGAAEALRDATASSEFLDGLSSDGFRTADRAPLADGAGVGEAEVLIVRDPNRLHGTLQRWRLLAMPARSLVLVDTSGSMGFGVPGTDRTRIEALVATATAGLAQFPDDAALGLWAFGGAAGRNSAPYAEVAALERLDAAGAVGSHRETLVDALATLPGLVGGGTDLYRSVLDAYAVVRSGYDPNMINSIIVISDGADDATSDLGEGEFLARLREMVTPSRPVIVVSISLLDDTGSGTLAEISRVTGGSTHVARTPDEIVRVFADAVGRRGGIPGA
ncbi:substrate-binding and VWA domain-containing protein [Dietzia sp. B32]|uniref:substrate-binding and VWA domain-containing protein n=1 Tax=Dietzia sp. B32 TaxID=2915130 RepID=UPI0021ADDA22|nr:substrate-binding and VWA domain-containing protein [Dietzia sp. B32]UVE94948.1 substrate-binding and VWA domain-containing protein [Dietzia sp. B32]